MSFCCLPVFSFAALMPVLAQAAMTETDFIEDFPVVLSPSRLIQPLNDSPAPVTVIDREMIRASGFTELQDVFRLVPGFLVAERPDGSPVVVNHGLGDAHSRRLQVLIDGRSVYDPFWGGVDWSSLPLRLEDVERIEVVRGPNQASYGANAFQGVINIITRMPAAEPGTGIAVSGGKRDFSDYNARFASVQGPLSWRISLSSREISGFEDKGDKPAYWREIVQRKVLNAQLSYQPDIQQEWRVQFGLSRGEDNAGTTSEANKYPYQDRGNDSNFLRLSWRNTYSPDSEITAQYYHYDQSYSQNYLKSNLLIAPTEQIAVDYGVKTRRDDLELQQIHTFAPGLKGVWGAGLRRDEVESDHYLYDIGKVSGNQWQVFGNLDWQFAPDWLLHVGGMLEKHYLTDTLFSPRLALNYDFAPSHSLRFSAGQGYRAPTFFEARTHEVFPNGVGGIADVGYWAYQDLVPEKDTFAELGYIGRFKPLNLGVDARIFTDKYENYIDNRSCNLESPGGCPFSQPAGYSRPSWFGNKKAFVFYNSGGLRVHGGDLSLDWRNETLGRFVASTSLTRISAGPGTDPDSEVSAPLHATTLLWSKTFAGKWNTSLGYYHVGYLKWPNDGDKQPAYHRVDVKLGRKLGKPGSDDEIALILQNVNSKHTEFYGYEVERQAFVTLRLSF